MRFRTVCALVALGFLASCSKGDPAAPSSASGLTASIAAPAPATPGNNALVRNVDQPVTLVVQNAVSTTTDPLTYTFEVATDSNFATRAFFKELVPQGSGGQTSLRIDPLAAARDYFWHVKASGGGTAGVFGPTSKFTIGAAVALGTPSPVSPLSGAQTFSRPTLTTQNAARQGQTGAILVTYTFEIANTPAFNPAPDRILIVTVSETASQTTFTPTVDLPIGATLYWRVTATDTTNNVASNPSAAQSFTVASSTRQGVLAAQIGATLWPSNQPSGTNGHATMGDNWDVATLYHVPTNTFFANPTIEELRLFDLIDRGFDPQAAINYLNSLSGSFHTAAQWYPPPEKAVIGLQYVYIGCVPVQLYPNCKWDIIVRSE